MKTTLLIICMGLAVFSVKTDSCWQTAKTGEEVFVLKKSFDPIHQDTLCIVVIRDLENEPDCKTLLEISELKDEEIDYAIMVLIAGGLRIEIFRKSELF